MDIGNALEKSWRMVEEYFTEQGSPSSNLEEATLHQTSPARIAPNSRIYCPVSREDARPALRHLVWLRDEVLRNLKNGNTTEAGVQLGLFQGAAWALGMATWESFEEANQEPKPKIPFEVDDFVYLLGDPQTIFRVAKISEGYMESTGTAFLVTLDGGYHGWEDFKLLRPRISRKIKHSYAKYDSLCEKAAALRKQADAQWESGNKAESARLHDEASALMKQANSLE